MPISHTNRKGQTYHLHVGTTRTGKVKYWFGMKAEGNLADSIPDGHEIYEKPSGQVFLRPRKPELITPEEVAIVRDGLARFAPGQDCLVDVEGRQIVVYHSDQSELNLGLFGLGRLENELKPFGFRASEYLRTHARYDKVLRFTLIDDAKRSFQVERWCFRGSVDRWIDLHLSWNITPLAELVATFGPHIGQESFFNLL